MSSTPLTSALPYYDREIEDQSLKSRVEAEINAEKVKMEKQEGLKDTLEQMVKDGRVVDEFHLFKDAPNLKALLESASKGEKLNALDTSRYQLAAPDGGLDASEEDWDKSIQNAQAQLGWADGRITNLELMRRYGANSYLLQNYLLQSSLSNISSSVTSLKSTTSNLHRDRRNAQIAAGQKLSSLEKQFGSLVSKNLEIQVENLGMGHKLEMLEERREGLKRKLREMDEEERA